MSNWKAAGPDHVQEFWFKKATSLHPKLIQHLLECLNAGAVPTWMTEGWTVLIMKDKSKGIVVGNYRLETVDKYIPFELPGIIAT